MPEGHWGGGVQLQSHHKAEEHPLGSHRSTCHTEHEARDSVEVE